MPISAPGARSKKSRSVHTNGTRSNTPTGAETSSDNTQFIADPLAILRASGTQRAALVAQLQRRTGNAHVTRVIRRLRAKKGTDAVVQRLEACVEPAPAPTMTPETDPAFQQVEAKTQAVAKNQKTHPPAKQEAGKAQAASVAPGNEVKSKAAAAQVGEMNQQKPGSFDKKAFIDSVEKAVEAITPKSEDEASDFKSSGKAGQVASQVGGMVSSNKQAAEKDIKHTTAAAPDPAKAGPKQKVIPLAPEVAKPRGAVNAAEGMPKPRPADQVSLAHTKCETDNQLEEADVTEDQLKNANEPQFDKAVEAKQEADAHAEEAPKQVRQEEKQALQATNVGANAAGGAGMTGMQAAGLKALKAVGSRKVSTKDKDEALRAEIAQKLEAVYGRTKGDVTKILDDLGPRVEAMFTSRERAARATFENYVDREMDAYKDRRYSGWGGKLRHLGDYTGITSLPDEVNVFYQTGRRNYLAAMRQVIGEVADVVGKELGRAKARIAQGRKEIDAEVSKLPKNQQKLGREAADNIQSRFDDLNSDVDSKQNELVQSIAKQYSEGIKAVDDKIEAMKEANKGLLQKAKDAIKGVIETIGKLKDMLFNVLAKAASVIGQIIRHPIDFLGNLVGAVKQGFNQFVDNIGKHLKNGLMGWLFGTLAEGGIQMPESFDLKGILSLVLQLLGLTYANIRARAVAIVGEKTVALLEKAVDVFKVLVAEGAAGLWKFISGKLGEMKDAVLDEIKGFVITKVITAGITWLLSMLNPASAFIKACKMIYDVVMFFVERGSQIMSLVNAILDGVIQIAGGSIGAAANMVENALGKAIPLAISFLASLLGVGGIAGKVKSVIEKIKAPVNKLVDGVVMGAAKGFKKLGGDKLIGLAQKGVGWAKQKVKQGVQWAKAKATAAKDWAAGKVKGAKAWIKGKYYGGKEEDKEKRLQNALVAGVGAVKSLRGARATKAFISPALSALKLRHRVPMLQAVERGGTWVVQGDIQRTTDVDTHVAVPTEPLVKAGERCGVWWSLSTGLGHKHTRYKWYPSTVESVDDAAQVVWMKIDKGGRKRFTFDQLKRDENQTWRRGDNTIHELFEPRNIRTKSVAPDGTRTIEYEGHDNTSFEVVVGPDDVPVKSIGKRLKLGSSIGLTGRRGEMESPDTHAENMGLHRAHVIADRFLGSGYKSAFNLVSVSARYNTQEMGSVERAIAGDIKTRKAQEFQLTVTMDWQDFAGTTANTAIQDAIAQKAAGLEKYEDTPPAQIQSALAQFMTSHANATGTKLKRCMKTDYEAKLTGLSGEEAALKYPLGPDVWVGLER
jgi:hypothetical protein